MHFIWKILISVYRFKALELMFLIGIASWSPWQANGMVIWSWKALKPSFQFSTFWQKTQVLFFVYGATGRSSGVGFASIYTCEWLGFRNWSKNPWIDEEIFDFYGISFQIFFMQTWFKSCPIIKILSKSDYTQNLETISCTKRFKKLGLVFSTYLF